MSDTIANGDELDHEGVSVEMVDQIDSSPQNRIDSKKLFEHLAEGFKATKMFKSDREGLPFLTEPGAPVSTFKIIANFIGQDLTRISLPVCINEPISLMQK